MDSIDIKILNFLQRNAKMTAKEMADKLYLTATPIYERIKKMEKSGVIKQYVALLDPELLNRSLVVFINIAIKEHRASERESFLNEIKKLHEIVELYHTSGNYDFIAKVRFSNVKEYKEFLVNRISLIPNIADIDSQIVLDEVKYSTRIDVLP